jgi:DNA-binding SARP family transcriptional activator
LSSNNEVFVRLVGELKVLRNDVAVALPPSKKTRALLAYLVATRTPQLRQRICDLLWDGPDDPRAALRWSLTKIRPIIDDAKATRLVADRDHVGFEMHGARVDLFEATTHVGADASRATTEGLRAAAAALRGEFLEGVELPDCYRFHEWCTGQRERVRALRLSVITSLVERLDDSPEEALEHARARITIDPLSDVAHAVVVRLLARLGRRAEALAQVDTCKRILERELGGRRSPALEVARLEIGRPVPGRDIAVGALPVIEVVPISARPSPALVARAREREVLASFAAATSDQILLLTGEPGIGKSRLLGDLAARVRDGGGLVLEGRAFEAEAVRPYGIWIDILRDPRIASFRRSELAPLLPELGDGAPNDAETKARLFDGIARLFRDLSASAPVAILVDDLHWLDEASAGLLGYLARVSAGTRVMIGCAARDGELSDNQAVLRFVRTLRREGRLDTLPVEPLDEDAITELVGAKTEEEATRIFRESGGNPLFAIEVARADQTGTARPLDALLEDRLARLDGRARDLLVWAAALGRQFAPELLVRVTGENLAQTIGAIGDLETQGLLSASSEGASYTFAHELIRKAVYRQLSGPRRRLVHLTIARALEATPDAAGDVVHHASLAEDALLLARACVAAGQRCMRMSARRQAKDFAERGLSVAPRLDLEEGIHLRAELLNIAAFSATATTTERHALEREGEIVAQLAREHGRPEDEATALFALSLLTSIRADFETTHTSTLRQAAAARNADPATSVPAIANTAFCLAFIERDVPKARALLDEAADLARIHGLSVIDLDLGEGVLSQFEGDSQVARKHLERVVAAGRAARDWWRESVALIRLGMLALDSGAFEETRTHAVALRAVAAKLGEGSEAITADALEALALQDPSRIEAAIRALSLADAKATLAFTLTAAAEIQLANGDLAGGRAFAEAALRAAEALGKPSAIIRAHVALGRATPDDAAAQLAAAQALIDHPYGISRPARDAVNTLAELVSNAGTNAGPHAARSKRRKR